MQVFAEQDRQELLKNLVIPPRPDILDALLALPNNPKATPKQLTDLIASDVALSIAMLKAANSPLIGQGRKIGSISQAVALLGMRNVIHLASGMVLRTRLTQAQPLAIELFWDYALQLAMINAELCKLLMQAPEACQSFALFHGCGRAIMLMRYPEYEDTLPQLREADDADISRIEQERHGASHDVVGYLVARVWLMPENFAQAILLQYDDHAFENPSALDHDARTMIAITRAARHVWRTLTPGQKDPGWERRRGSLLSHLGLDLSEFEDWRDDMHQRLA